MNKLGFLYLKKKLESSSKKNWILFLICIFEVSFFVSILPVLYEFNDDIGMSAIASGAASGDPSEYLIFSNIIIGYLLKFFFNYFPNVNWYTWYLLTSLILGYFAIQYSFGKLNKPFWVKVMSHLLILSLILTAVLTITFTEIAAVAVIGGIMLLYSSEKNNYVALISGVLLIVLGSLIRADVFKMVMLIGLPLFLYWIYKKQYQKLLFLLFAIVLGLGTIIIDNTAYTNNPELKEYREFNELRSKLTAFDNSQLSWDKKLPVLKEVGWSFYDFELATYFNLDTGHPKFSKEILRKIVDFGPDPYEKLSFTFLYESYLASLRSLMSFIEGKIEWLLIFCFFAFLFFEKRWKQIFMIMVSAIYLSLLALIIITYLEGNLKPNISFGLLLPLGLLIIYFLKFDKLFRINGRYYSATIKIVLVLFSFALFCIPVLKQLEIKDMINHKIELNKRTHFVLMQQPETFYMNWIVFEFINIFDVPYDDSKSYRLGWVAGSPYNKDKIERYTGNRDLGIYTIFNKDIVWYYEPNMYYNWFARRVKNFYQHNYPNVSFKVETVPVTENEFLIKHIYHIKR